MKKFLKIVLFGILTLSLINISDTKINFLSKGDNVSIEKVKVPRKNAYGDESLINDLTDLSYTEWHQSGNLASTVERINQIFSYDPNQKKVLDIINYNNREEKQEVYTNFNKYNGSYIQSWFSYGKSLHS